MTNIFNTQWGASPCLSFKTDQINLKSLFPTGYDYLSAHFEHLSRGDIFWFNSFHFRVEEITPVSFICKRYMMVMDNLVLVNPYDCFDKKHVGYNVVLLMTAKCKHFA